MNVKTILIGALLFSVPAFAQDKGGDAEAKTAEKPAKPAPDITKLPFSPDTIKLVVTYNMDKIQACYEDMLAGSKKKVEGKIMTSFTITPEGMVKKAKVEKKQSTLKDPKFHDCVVATLATMEFPRPPDGADHPIEYPFNLKAVE